MSYQEQIMVKDKYSSIFSPQMEAIVFQIFFTMHTVLKIGEYSWIFPSLSYKIFAHVMRFAQLYASAKHSMDYKIRLLLGLDTCTCIPLKLCLHVYDKG